MIIRSVSLAAILAAATTAAQGTTTITVDAPPGLAARPLLPDVVGYSIEPVWVSDYASTPLARNLLGAIGNITGRLPPIRVGGNTADQTYLHSSLPTGNDSVAVPDPAGAQQFNVTPAWYEAWAAYFLPGTDFVYTLNLRDDAAAWDNAVAEAEAVHAALGDKLVLLELGNEIDHFINKGWREPGWDVEAYVAQFRNLTGRITGSEWYKAAASPPKFQAGVFGDPPRVPDQQDEVDDFSIENLTHVLRPEDRDVIGSYSTHLYPQSTCDPERWLRMRLDLLSNHTVVWLNISQYAPQVAAADAAGASLVMGETNSVSCSGKSGISDTFGAALWTADYVLAGAALGIRKTYFHLGAQSEYSAFTPRPYALKNETLRSGIRANWYGHYFVARVAAPPSADDKAGNLTIAALPSANSSSLSGYAVYAGGAGKQLRKVVLLDMGVWNGTDGLHNDATLSATDGADFSVGPRPNSTIRVATPWQPGASVAVVRLTGPGTNAKSGVAVAGVRFDPSDGRMVGEEQTEKLTVGADGEVEVGLSRAEGVLLELVGTAGDGDGDGHGNGEPEVGGSAAVKRAVRLWTVTIVVAGAGLFAAL
ncbi:hypothetical protein GGR52DRAFT_553455 [Hypoxylon sp. FL1284]|nr:hypothetical protein GGR52DRAFT_553455 [Hypoxylon sp. FL1284]